MRAPSPKAAGLVTYDDDTILLTEKLYNFVHKGRKPASVGRCRDKVQPLLESPGCQVKTLSFPEFRLEFFPGKIRPGKIPRQFTPIKLLGT